MKTILCAVILLFCALLLTACFEELDDGYQFGDISHMTARKRSKLKQHRNDYCSKTSDSITKKVALLAIKTELPAYPTDGICTGFNDKSLKQIESEHNKPRGLPPDPDTR